MTYEQALVLKDQLLSTEIPEEYRGHALTDKKFDDEYDNKILLARSIVEILPKYENPSVT
jgi:hypothetical protein